MNKLQEMIEELEVLEELCRKAEKEYFDGGFDLAKEEAFGEACNAESAAFVRICKYVEEKTNKQILSHMTMRMLIHKRDAFKEIVSCI